MISFICQVANYFFFGKAVAGQSGIVDVPAQPSLISYRALPKDPRVGLCDDASPDCGKLTIGENVVPRSALPETMLRCTLGEMV